MNVSNFPTTATGWMAIVTGLVAILALVFLILMAAVNAAFGKVNDVFNSLIGIASVILAWLLYAEFQSKALLMSRIALVLVLVGAVFLIIGSILVISGATGFVLSGWYSSIGSALIGLWLAGFCYSQSGSKLLPDSLIVFGIATGALMVFGLIGIPGIVAKVDSMKGLPWYLYIAFIAWLGTYIFYPFWAIWLGRQVLSGK